MLEETQGERCFEENHSSYQVKRLVLADIENVRWFWLPSVIYLGCFTELCKGQADLQHALQHIEYEDLTLTPTSIKTRKETDLKCNCSVCSVGRLKVLLNTTMWTQMILNIG